MKAKNIRRAVLLDRDGVINVERKDYVKSWEEFVFLPGIGKAISRLNEAGYLVIVVTNQSCIGRGIISEKQLEVIHEKMIAELAKEGAIIDAIYYCPHRPDEECDCRKPKMGLIVKAIDDLKFDREQSWLIGDSESDMIAGLKMGLKSVLVSETTKQMTISGRPIPVFPDLLSCAEFILSKA